MSDTSQSIRKSLPSCSASGADPPLERLALIGESELGALLAERLGDAPGERAVVGEAHDQAALSLHQAGHMLSLS